MSNLLARAVSVVGSPTAGILLYRIAYWQAKTKFVRDGKKWVVMTRDAWWAETGLSEKQHRLAQETLVARGLIEVDHHLHQGVRKAWIRLSEAGRIAMGGSPQRAKGVRPRGQSKFAPEGDANNSEIPSEIGSEVSSAVAGAEGSDMKPSKQSAKDFVAAFKAKGDTYAPVSSKALGYFWQEQVEKATGDFQPPLTMQKIGMLKNFAAKCPNGMASDVIRVVVADWAGFSKRVEIDVGLKKSPQKPSIEFLLKHVATAVSFADEALKSPSKEAKVVMPVGQPLQSIAMTQPVAEDADDKPVSLEDLLKILNEDPDGE